MATSPSLQASLYSSFPPSMPFSEPSSISDAHYRSRKKWKRWKKAEEWPNHPWVHKQAEGFNWVVQTDSSLQELTTAWHWWRRKWTWGSCTWEKSSSTRDALTAPPRPPLRLSSLVWPACSPASFHPACASFTSVAPALQHSPFTSFARSPFAHVFSLYSEVITPRSDTSRAVQSYIY